MPQYNRIIPKMCRYIIIHIQQKSKLFYHVGLDIFYWFENVIKHDLQKQKNLFGKLIALIRSSLLENTAP